MVHTAIANDSATSATLQPGKIRQLNDDFRGTFVGGRVVVTQGVAALPEDRLHALLHLVRTFDSFSAGNDPHEEHDFGSIDFEAERYFWKIDYYDRLMEFGSADSADPSLTVRVLTVMRADEY